MYIVLKCIQNIRKKYLDNGGQWWYIKKAVAIDSLAL